MALKNSRIPNQHGAFASEVHHLSQREAAWLAGFFDGEGCYQDRTRGRRGTRILIVNTELSALEYCRRITGVGMIYPIKREDESWRPIWTWAVTRREDVKDILRQMKPYRQIIKRSEKNP